MDKRQSKTCSDVWYDFDNFETWLAYFTSRDARCGGNCNIYLYWYKINGEKKTIISRARHRPGPNAKDFVELKYFVFDPIQKRREVARAIWDEPDFYDWTIDFIDSRISYYDNGSWSIKS